jgi:urea transport system substrate-binding protein
MANLFEGLGAWRRRSRSGSTAVVLLLTLSLLLGACATPAAPAASSAAPAAASGDTIKVGILHSLSGTMAISEVSVKDATLLAIEEINAAGGINGKLLEPIIEDGASDWPTFAEKARKLIQQDGVAVVFGCWTSASRKAVLPVFEELNGLLFYPVQYEGLESSPKSNIWSTTWAPRASTCSAPTMSSPAPPISSSRPNWKHWA